MCRSTASCAGSAGKRLDEVIAEWYQRFPWKGPSVGEMHDAVLDEVTRLIIERGKVLPGVIETMQTPAEQDIRMGIASSSPPALIESVVTSLGLEPYLKLIHSGALEARGKPDPAVLLTTATKLGVAPHQCVVFEDAPTGIKAARRAGMHVIAVPSVFELDHPGILASDLVLESLADFRPELLFAYPCFSLSPQPGS